MSSSDSEDDCYSHAAQRLKMMMGTFKVDITEGTNLLNNSAEIDEIVKDAEITLKSPKKSSKKRGKKAADVPSTAIAVPAEKPAEVCLETAPATSKRRTRSAASNSVQAPAMELSDTVGRLNTVEETPAPATTGVRGKARRNRTPRGRGRGSRQLAQSTLDAMLDRMLSATTRRRGRSPRRSRGRRQASFNLSRSIQDALPIYSVGNTYEYPDECHSQALFSNKAPAPKKDDEIVDLDANDSLNDNEELSMKVFWQSSEYFRFNIRKFQKITQIFDYFSKKENVSFGNLLFTLNDRILKPDDTPDSIDYNTGNFIDGGVVKKNMAELAQSALQRKKGDIKIKFQCQNVKKPFEISVYLDETLSVAMLKCAEHLEQSMDKLKFYLDGDVVSVKSTARELELEGGECIDVKVLS